ncbi:uncharacterized protein LOC108677154 isoform X4 [Hyalella azteca]|uniref:Uncharacterized protein LOC108677154 isoform X4 n=1 Tax=Hyalella azteca TaxID=294128 RepID=A0A8B7P3W0_HYAAZ|nr:uncharacterized protein LOC108677154 isoform X4 [Hyalella azteca]
MPVPSVTASVEKTPIIDGSMSPDRDQQHPRNSSSPHIASSHVLHQTSCVSAVNPRHSPSSCVGLPPQSPLSRPRSMLQRALYSHLPASPLLIEDSSPRRGSRPGRQLEPTLRQHLNRKPDNRCRNICEVGSPCCAKQIAKPYRVSSYDLQDCVHRSPLAISRRCSDQISSSPIRHDGPLCRSYSSDEEQCSRRGYHNSVDRCCTSNTRCSPSHEKCSSSNARCSPSNRHCNPPNARCNSNVERSSPSTRCNPSDDQLDVTFDDEVDHWKNSFKRYEHEDESSSSDISDSSVRDDQGSLVPLEDGSRAMPPLPSLFDKHFTRLGTPPDTPRSVLALGSRVPTSAHKASPSSACCLKERCSDADESRRRASLVHRRCLSDHPRRNSQHSRESSVERTSCAQSSSDAWGSRRRYDDISDDILVAGDSCCRHFATKSSSHDRPQVGALRHSYHEDLSTRSLDRRRSGFRESLSWGWTRDVPCCGYHHGLLPTDIKDSNYHLPVIGGDQGRCSASQQDDLDASGCCYGDSRLQVERLYDLEANKSSLELQVSVLQEQVEAQAEKISELEALLRDKNRQLLLTEERLQKEVMAVSGLETQRLQLLSELSCLQLEQAAAAQGSSARSPLIQDNFGVGLATSTPVRSYTASPSCSLSPSLAGFVTPSALNGPSSSPAPGRLQDSVRSFGPPRTPPPNFGREADAGAAVLRVARCGSASTASKPTTLPHLHASGAGGKYSAMTAGVAEATTRTSRFASERTSSVDGAGDDTSGTSPGTCDASKPGGVGLAPFGAPGKRCASAPNLAETEKQSQSCHQSPNIAQRLVNGQHTAEERQTYGPADGCLASPGSPADGGGMRKSPPSIKTLSSGNLHNIQSLEQYCDNQQQSSPITSHKPNTIKKIFTRLRRSSSGRQSPPGTRTQDLRRGGVRATATARLGGTAPRPVAGAWQEPSGSLETWSSADCVEWMTALGLSQYTTALRCWLGDPSNHLSRATSSQLDKQLGVRHPLHRKKLQLAIASRMGSYPSLAATSPSERIEGSTASASWISQWLDDVGLPQYKDAFHEACVDPRVLNVLTWEDLAFLKVTSLLHAVSIKRGIQVLREHNFDSSVLLRRSNSSPTFNDSANNNINNNSGSNGVAQEVERWTNHRVMEWLKTVDLSEYAPNLRGSGVHGALLVYEVRFNAEVLAALLSIPASKTLLRRHLNTHFKELVGRDVVHEKREVENAPGFSPLTTATKVKPSKRSQFSLKRRSSSSSRNGGKGRPALEFDDLLCPLEERRPRAALSAASQLANSPETR